MAAPRVLRLPRPSIPLLRPRHHHFCFSSSSPSPSSSSSSSTSSTPFSSVSPSEVSHFNDLASTWWDPHGPSRLLHLMNPLRHDFIRACFSSSSSDASPDSPTPSPPRRFLDIGCGGGIFAESAARLPSTQHVLGIDPTPNVLAVARAHARRDPLFVRPPSSASSPGESDPTSPPRLEYRLSSLEQLPLPPSPDRRFDVVSLFEVLEHVSHPASVLERAAAFLRPGGWLVGSTISRTLASWVTTKLLAEDVLRIVPRGTHDWSKYINEDELRVHLLRQGWESPRFMGVVYVPGLGWKEVEGSGKVGNYFFGARKPRD